MSKEWFEWYVKQVGKQKSRATYRDRFLCPCCYMPTLNEPGSYDICSLCFWEDDGQDSDDADVVRGGPNHSYSLQEARANFASNLTMYRSSDAIAFKREQKKLSLKQKIYRGYIRAIRSGKDADWKKDLIIERIARMNPVTPLNLPATEVEIRQTFTLLPTSLPKEYIQILEVANGIITDEFVLYSCQELSQHNAVDKSGKYTSGRLAIGDNGKDKVIVLGGKAGSPVSVVDYSLMRSSSKMVRVSDSLVDWIDYGCQLDSDRYDFN